MAYEQRDNSGSLFRNKRKEQPNHPDHTGTCMVGGVEYFINAWIKEGRDGSRFFSFSFKPKNPPAEASRPIADPGADLEDEIPF